MPAKDRVDKVLVARGLVESREKAQALCLAGRVFLGNRRIDKPGTAVSLDAMLTVQGELCPYVSRGGLKLAGVLDPLGISPAGRVCLDLGASTGGFTDVLLQHGAVRVWAVDVGRAQLHERLRNDPRVLSREGVNARHGLRETVTETVSLVVIDVSFISLTKVLGAVLEVLDETDSTAAIVAMVKPQFELGPHEARGGVVREDALRTKAVEIVVDSAQRLGLRELGRQDSPVHGPAGNREIFVRFGR